MLNVLRHWVEFHYYDFERHPKLLEKLRSFVDSVKNKAMQKWVVSIQRSLQKKEAEKPASALKHVFNQQSEPVEWHIAKTREEYHILTVSISSCLFVCCWCFIMCLLSVRVLLYASDAVADDECACLYACY